MKRLVSILLLAALALALVGCGEVRGTREITCEDIATAYEEAGYTVIHGTHTEDEDAPRFCYIKAHRPGEEDGDYVYFTTYLTEQKAKEAAKKEKYNLGAWFIATILGESRWLRGGVYGRIVYSYYDKELIAPFEALIQ